VYIFGQQNPWHLVRVRRAVDPSWREALDLCEKGTYMGNIWIFDCMRRALDMIKEGRGHSLDLCGKTFDLNRGTCT
jgi:hypothetical protein